MADLTTLLNPRTIAVVGASKDASSVSGRFISILQNNRYDGRIFPINPKYTELAGFTCYRDVFEVPGTLDMALLAVSSKRLVSSLEQCGQKGVKNVIIITSGFAETGGEGVKLQKKIKEIADGYNMRICGPNCIGIVNIPDRVYATFSPSFIQFDSKEGSIGIVGHSGALVHAIFVMAQGMGLGFSHVISSGNEADLTAADFVNYLIDDPRTRVIVAYLETWRNEAELFHLGEKARQKNKPLLFLKVGSSQVGQRAALSHTASLTGSDDTYAAAFNKAGVIRARDIDELLSLMSIFAAGKKMSGYKIGVITASGGLGILLADKAEENGLELPRLEKMTEETLLDIIPAYGSTLNPVDVTAQVLGEPEMLGKCIDALIKDPNLDAIVTMLTLSPGKLAAELAGYVVEMQKSTDKPLVVCWCGSEQLSKEGFDVLKQEGIPLYHSPGACARSLKALADYTARCKKQIAISETTTKIKIDQKRKREASEIIQQSKSSVTEYDAKKVLSLYGIGTTREYLVNSAQEAVARAEEIGFPICLKIVSPEILHKTEAGGVLLNITDPKGVEKGFHKVLENAQTYNPRATLEGVLVQEMLLDGVQVIIGSSNTSFGPLILFGLGGIFVEILGDVSKRIAPISWEEARTMIQEIKGYHLLTGFRGQKASDIKALGDALVNFSVMAWELQEHVAEIDINPLLVLPEGHGIKAVDALMVKTAGQ